MRKIANQLFALFILLLSGCQSENSISEKLETLGQENPFSEFIQAHQFVLDSQACDLNNDEHPDLILLLDDIKNNKENAQHESPIPVIILKGIQNGYVNWMQNDQIIEDLDDNCPADGFQKLIVSTNSFTIQSTVCQDGFYVTQIPTFKFNK